MYIYAKETDGNNPVLRKRHEIIIQPKVDKALGNDELTQRI